MSAFASFPDDPSITLTDRQLENHADAAWDIVRGRPARTIFADDPWASRLSWLSHEEQCRQVQVRREGGPICPYTGRHVDE